MCPSPAPGPCTHCPSPGLSVNGALARAWWLRWWSVVRALTGVVSVPSQGTYWVAGWVRKHTGGNRSMLLARSLSLTLPLSQINKHPPVRKINKQSEALFLLEAFRTCCSLFWNVLFQPLLYPSCSMSVQFLHFSAERDNCVEEATLEKAQFLLLVCWQTQLFIPG